MVQVEWKQILEITPESLSEQKKEELYELAWFDPEPENDPGHLKHLISILAEILKFKGEQVDSLIVELDSLAAKQGQEEARQHQLQSVEQLYSGNTTDVENLRKELIQIELQNEKLMSSIQEKDDQILEDQNQIKKLSDSVAMLEREKVELQRELTALQQEISEQQESKTNNTESTEHYQELLEAISQKNKHISQLLVDVEVIERENTELRKTLSSAKDELSDATHHLESLSNENISLTTTIHAKDEKIEELGKQMQGLRNQVEDLIDDKTKRDQELEELAKALDSRVQLWKEKIDTKNEKIEELKQKLQQFGNVDSYPNIKVPEETQQEHSELLNALLKKRELQIEQLQNQLLQATQDLNETTALLERKDNVFSKTKITESSELKQKLEEAQQEIGSLQKRVIEAEEDARRKAEEMY
ncbi:hypothetical protein M8J76_015678 [Diaphorina citri]|nr:hypothetical protein M8J76_015678 [Diaphorina citri]